MFFQSQAVIQAALDAVLAGPLGIGGTGMVFKLAQTPFTPSATSDPTADFTEANYTGYAPQTVTTALGDRLAGNSWEATLATLAAFSPTGTTVGNVIGGYWVEDIAGAFLGYDVFPIAVPMQSPSDAIQVAARWQQQPASWPNTILP